jgi:Na+/H+ antiporter
VEHLGLIIFGLLVALASLMALAGALRIPYPIILVIGGAGLGFVPGVPRIALDPELVLLIFLPPLLYSAAFFTSLSDLRANVRPVAFLSVGLVLATMTAVAAVAHYAIGLPWPVAFVLGAVVSPTDPLAATAVARRLGAPRRLVSVIEGESLINDGTALVAYGFAVAAVVTGSFAPEEAVGRFLLNVVGGVGIGLIAGFLIYHVRKRLNDPPVEVAISLVSTYVAYLPAEELGVSGVLAAVTVGIFMGWHTPVLTTPTTRMLGDAVWEMLTFVLNSVLFLLIGLQLPTIIEVIGGELTPPLLLYAVIAWGSVLVTRAAWVVLFAQVLPRLRAPFVFRNPPPLRNTAIVGWMGLRGAVSLAAALAIPLTVEGGAPFPARDLVIFLTFAVTFATLVVQGLTLPPLIRALGVRDDGADEEAEEVRVRLTVAEAALERMEDLTEEDWVRDDTADRMRDLYDYRRRRFAARHNGDGDAAAYEERSADFQRLRRELIDAERRALMGLRGRIGDEVLRRVERDLDLEDARLG